jgi:DNA-binding MarR family transcriptional regulator
MEQTSNDTRKLSFPKVRGAQTEPFRVYLNNSTGRYEVVSGGDNEGTKSLSDRILAELAKDPYKRFEQEEISGLLGIPSSQKDSVYQALARLFKRGLITKRPSTQGGKRKVYGVANPSQLSHTEGLRNVTDTIEDTPPPSSLIVSVQISETVDIQEIELTDTLTDSLTDTLLTHQNDVHGKSSSNEELESVSAKLTITDSQGGVCPQIVETVTQEAGDLAIAPVAAPATETNEVAQPDQRSDGGFQVTDDDSWLDKETIQDIVGHLELCSDREALAELRKAWTSEAAKKAMDLACDQLSAEKSAQTKQWVVELNAGESCQSLND